MYNNSEMNCGWAHSANYGTEELFMKLKGAIIDYNLMILCADIHHGLVLYLTVLPTYLVQARRMP